MANEARLEAIKRISREEVEIGMLMLAEVRARIPTAAKLLARSPRVLALWAEVGAKLARDGLATGELNAVASDPKAPVQHELRGILHHLTPAQVLQARKRP